MTAKLLHPATVFECSMCSAKEWSSWRAIADAGWCSHSAGPKLEPIILCPDCSCLIAERRGASLAGAA